MTSDAEIDALREQVALANRLLHHYGLGAYQGHVSARIPGTDHVIIRATPAVSLERVEANDLMVIDLDGNVVAGERALSGTGRVVGAAHRDLQGAPGS